MIEMEKIIDFYGKESQARIAMEECAELIQAINKGLRYPEDEKRKENIAEEMADVYIILKQLEYIFNISKSDIEYFLQKKQERIVRRYNIAKGKNE